MNKHIASLPLVMVNKQTKIKIGKITDDIDIDKCLVQKEGKNLKLSEKKSKKIEIKYSGNLSAEQTSKYMLIRFNPNLNQLEAYPTDDWYSFKKDIVYNTISLDEAEEKMKQKSGYMDYFKGKTPTPSGKGGRGVKKSSEDDERRTLTIKFKEEEVPKAKLEEMSEQEEEEADAELKDIPSDIEEEFLSKSKQKEETKTLPQTNEDEEVTESDDSIFGKQSDDEKDNAEDGELSDIEEEFDKLNSINSPKSEFLGVKRKPSDITPDTKTKKQKSIVTQMEDELNNVFARNRQMTYEKIVKELTREFSSEEIEMNLRSILDRISKKFIQKGEYYYFKNLNN